MNADHIQIARIAYESGYSQLLVVDLLVRNGVKMPLAMMIAEEAKR